MMLAALQMVLVAQGVFLPPLPAGIDVSSRSDCVRKCYFDRTCSSVFFDKSTNMCHLVDTVYIDLELGDTSTDRQYLVWNTVRPGRCRSGYSFNQTLNLCFKIYSLTKSWRQAEAQCIQDGGQLIKVDTVAKNDLVTQHYSEIEESFWIGGNDRAVDRTWRWADNTAVESTFWASGQPDNSAGEDCIFILRSGGEIKWHDVDCFQEIPFICEVPVIQQYHVCRH